MAPGGSSQTLPKAATESAREARRSFFCELCQKGYARMNEFEAHEGSYDHLHRKRLKDMRQMTKDPNAAAKARAAEERANEEAGLRPVSLPLAGLAAAAASSSSSTPKKKPVFKSTLQAHNVGLVPGSGNNSGAGSTNTTMTDAAAAGGGGEGAKVGENNDKEAKAGENKIGTESMAANADDDNELPPWAAHWDDEPYDPAYPTEYREVDVVGDKLDFV